MDSLLDSVVQLAITPCGCRWRWTQPVCLSQPDRLVLSPHVYGPSVEAMDYFHDAAYPANLEDIWEARFGHALSCTDDAMVVGEFGGDAARADDPAFQCLLVG